VLRRLLSSGVRTSLLALLIPEGLVVLAAAALLHWNAPLAPLAPFLPAFPWVTFGAATLLAIRFGHSGVVLALAALALGDRAAAWSATSPTLLPAAALLLPLNLAAFGALRERGLLSASAAWRGIALLAQVAIVLLLVRPGARAAAGPVHVRFLPSWLGGGAAVGDLALVAFAAVAVLYVVLIVRRGSPQPRGFLWCLVAAFLALSAGSSAVAPGLSAATFLFGTGALVLLVTVIEGSHALAYRDALTALPSRRAFDDALERLDGPCAIAMADVDHFKSVNDRHGHDVGDQVLRLVARVLGGVSHGGRAFRYGGEEFALLFPGRTAAECADALEECRAALEATRFTLRAPDRPRKKPQQAARRATHPHLIVTLSIGVADRTAGDVPPTHVLQAADEALYRAKQAGRNRMVVAGARGGHASGAR
jgi:diguanylate cyclase (GGDEF)-like protein